MSCAKWVTFLSIFVFFSSHLLRNPFLHFPTKRCLSPQFVFPLLTHTFKVDGDSDPIDLSSSQLQLSFSAARTDSSRLKLISCVVFRSSLILCCDACFVFAVKSLTVFPLFSRFQSQLLFLVIQFRLPPFLVLIFSCPPSHIVIQQ